MFDMLLESGHRSALPSWGKGVALTLHVLVLGALWRTQAPTHPDVPMVIDYDSVYSDQPVTHKNDLVPPAPDPYFDGGIIPTPQPFDVPVIPHGTPGVPAADSGREELPNGPTQLTACSDPCPLTMVQEAPELLTAPTPVYPPLLRDAGVQGRVIVAAVVDTMGRAESGSVRIVLSDNPGFDRAALATVRAARFRPARIYGRAVRVLVQVPVVFRLN
jgi:TonB family protein